MKDRIITLWLSLLEIQARVEGIDLSGVPDCVLEHYAAKDYSVRQALDAITA